MIMAKQNTESEAVTSTPEYFCEAEIWLHSLKHLPEEQFNWLVGLSTQYKKGFILEMLMNIYTSESSYLKCEA